MPDGLSELPDLEKLCDLVRAAARDELMGHFGNVDYHCKTDGSVVTQADFAMQNRLEAELKTLWPQFDMLGEEMEKARQQAIIDNSKGYWCIDPLDGTTNFTAGIPVFAVSIALIINSKQELGLIYDPVKDEMFTAIRGEGAWLNGVGLKYDCGPVAEDKPIIAEIDLKRLPVDVRVRLVSESIFSSQRNVGSSAIDWAWLAAGRYDIYLHGGQKLWDYAAGSLIFCEAGGRCVSFDDDAVFRGKLEKRSVLGAFDEALFKRWYDWLSIPIY